MTLTADHPSVADALTLLHEASTAQRKGEYATARTLYAELLAIDPHQPDALHFIGLIEYQEGNAAAGLAKVEEAVRLRPQAADFLSNLGSVYLGLGRMTDALKVYTRSLEINPRNAGCATNLGIALSQAGQHEAAVALARKGLGYNPGNAPLLSMLGNALRLKGDREASLAAYQELVKVAPDDPESYYNLGVIQQDLWQMLSARQSYEKAIALSPTKPQARYFVNHGAALLKLEDVEGARQSYLKSLELAPDLAEAHYNYAICLLLLGHLREGAQHYEWRLKIDKSSLSNPRDTGLPEWDGAPALDKTLLLHSEQGFGDMIQFIRFAPAVAVMVKKVVIEMQEQLLPLFRESFPKLTFIARGQELPPCDLQIPLMSLLERLKIQPDDLPASGMPYLQARTADIVAWKKHLSGKPGKKIAISWQGNPRSKVDRGRSQPLTNLIPILQLEGYRFICIQKNDGLEQLDQLPPELRARIEVPGVDVGTPLNTFLDTAAVMQNCDLVLSTDTAVVHVAGGLGRPTYVMLKKMADWRWLMERADCPWYPTMRLFRQPVEGDWASVITAVKDTLLEAKASSLCNASKEFERAIALHQQGQIEAAEQIYRTLPDNPQARHYLGVIAYQRGQADIAETHIRTALAQKPGDADMLANLTLVLKAQGRLEEAVAVGCEVLLANPQHGATHNNLANTLKALGRTEEALPHYMTAVRLAPNAPELVHNLGLALLETNRLEEAQASLAKAVELVPESADFHFDLARCLLARGVWPLGWAEYEWRRKMSEFGAATEPSAPRWTGEVDSSLTLLITGEQGLGDSLQFARFIKQARERVGRVVLVVPALLKALLQSVPGVDEVRAYGEALPHYDVHLPLPSLPDVFGTTLDTLPITTPYVGVEAARFERFKSWRSSIRGFVVGLNWQGNPKARADIGRSLHLRQLRALGDLSGITFVVLQKGKALEQVAELPAGFPLVLPPHPYAEGEDGFLDTAALMSVCDLVLTTDTSVAHLAGALGVKTWVMLKYAPDWRWMTERSDSPWYPNTQLFRQSKEGDWDGVIAQVKSTLQQATSVLQKALALHQQGRLEEAVTLYTQVLEREPDEMQALHYYGVARYQLGAVQEAEGILHKVITLKPDYADAWGNYALTLKHQEKFEEAARAFTQSLSLNPNNADVHNNFGNLLCAVKKHEAALSEYREAIRIAPSRADGYQNLGNALGDLERYDEAAEAYQRAIALKPGYVGALNGLGKVYRSQEKIEQAIAVFREAAAADPASADAWSNLGVCYRELRDYEQALICYDEALSRNPQHAETFSNRAIAQHYSGRLEESEASYRQSLFLKPDKADAHFGLAAVLLSRGLYEEGWAEYEWRRQMKECGPLRSFPQPLWDGTPAPDKTLFLFAEQGFGDTIQFIRFLKLARSMVGAVVVEVQPGLRRMIKAAVGDATVIGQGEALPPFDLYAPLMSLPHLLKLSEFELGMSGAYLEAEPELVEFWAERLGNKPGLRVGLQWQGNPKGSVDKGRSIPLKQLEPLLRMEGVRFISLQKNAGAEQIAALPDDLRSRIETLGDDYGEGSDAFIDSAAVMQNCDLVLSTCTAMAHVAGAHGRPVFVMLKYMCDWRWLLNRTDNPWYPSAQLFRQQTEGDWDGVVDAVKAELENVLAP